jgi:hypothetical protein
MEDTLHSAPADAQSRDTEGSEPIVFESASQPFVGRWNDLVSTTNWEKGRIIAQWREALMEADAPVTEYSDEAWARRVGAVTAQHVGRLRRVHSRFGDVYGDYEGLYWSHFHAALDWDDAEMWLEGAAQSKWSVSQMRRQRWESMGAIADQEPRDTQIVTAETDEDVNPALDQDSVQRVTGELAEIHGPPATEDSQSAEPSKKSPRQDDDGASIYADDTAEETVEFVRPFENLAELPDDLAEAFEGFKLAILRHKAEGWSQISREDVLASLDALKELARAPSVD